MRGASLLDGPALDDFTDALEVALARIGRPCTVIEHSLGGAVAQNLLKRGVAPKGAVLMASVPPYGTWRASAEMALTIPELWRNLALFSLWGPNAADLQVLCRTFFPGGVADDVFTGLMRSLRDDPVVAMAQATGMARFAPLPGMRRDVLVTGEGAIRLCRRSMC